MKKLLTIWVTTIILLMSAYIWNSFKVKETRGNYSKVEGFEADYPDMVDDIDDVLTKTVRDTREHFKEPIPMPEGNGTWLKRPASNFWDDENFDLEFINVTFQGGNLTIEVYLSGHSLAPAYYVMNITVLTEDLRILRHITHYNEDLWTNARDWEEKPSYLVVSIQEVYNITEEGQIVPYNDLWGRGRIVFDTYINLTFNLDEGDFYFMRIRELTKVPVIRTVQYIFYGIVGCTFVYFTADVLSALKKERTKPNKDLKVLAWKYKFHALFFLAAVGTKYVVDSLNDPIRDRLGWDFTGWVFSIEGDSVLHIQKLMFSNGTTLIMTSFYTIGLLFLSVYILLYFFAKDDWDMATKIGFNYWFIYFLAVPFYLLFPVFVTSQHIPEMKAIMYDYDPFVHNWSFSIDVFDNCFPSLHVGVLFTAVVMIWLECRSRGQTVTEAGYLQPFSLALMGTIIFVVSVIYLGIHWLIDIPTGMMLAVGCALLTRKISWRVDRRLKRANSAAERWIKERQRRKNSEDDGMDDTR